MKTIHTAHSIPEADCLKMMLESHDIPCHIQGYHHRGMLGMVGAFIELNLMVPEEAIDDAVQLLQEWQSSHPEEIAADDLREDASRHEPKSKQPRSRSVCIFLAIAFPGLASFYVGAKNMGFPLCIGTITSLAGSLILMPTGSSHVGILLISLPVLMALDMRHALRVIKIAPITTER